MLSPSIWDLAFHTKFGEEGGAESEKMSFETRLSDDTMIIWSEYRKRKPYF